MKASDELAEEIKKLAKKKGEEMTDDEAQDGARRLTGFFDLLWGLAKKDAERQRRLKKEPDGFPVDGSYSCLACGRSINEMTGWYDWYGQTCLICHKAVKGGVIPTYIFKNRDSYFSMSSLNYTFNIKHQTAKKYIKEGKLVPRIILDESGRAHEYIFLKRENPSLVQRYCPERKSFDRNRAKKADKWAREKKAEMMEEHQKQTEKINKLLKKS